MRTTLMLALLFLLLAAPAFARHDGSRDDIQSPRTQAIQAP
jgi:hypothetical protein